MDSLIIVMTIFVVLVGLLLGVALAWRQRQQSVTVVNPQPQVHLDPALETHVVRLLAQQHKIQAVKYVRDQTGWGLREAKDYVDALEQGRALPELPPSVPSSVPSDQPQLDALVQSLLAKNQKIVAIKHVREQTGWDLKRSKEYVERFE